MTRRVVIAAAAATAIALAGQPLGAATVGPKLTTLPTSSPMVAFRLLFRTGSIDDPRGQEGLASLSAALVGQGGTKELSYAEVIAKLYPMAARIEVNTDKEATVFVGEVHRDHLEAFYAIFKSLLLQPRFDPADFERLRSDATSYLENGLRGSDDEELGKRALQAVLYKGHPYAHVEAGTVEGLRAIRLADVQGFYRTRFTLDRLTIGIAGGYPKGFPERVRKDLTALPAKGAARVELPAPVTRSRSHVTLIQKEAMADAISWGFPVSFTRSDDDFFALMVASSWFGEHRTFRGLLMNRLREARGLNYGDYSYIENFVQEGGSTFPIANIPRRQQFFSIWIRPVKPANAGFALRGSIYHFEKMLEDGIPQADFDKSRDFLLGYSRLWAQTTSRRLGYKMDSEWYGRKDFLAEIAARLPRLTKADVDAALRRQLAGRALEIVIVSGRAEALAKELASGSATPIRYDTEGTPQEILTEDKVIEAWPLRLAATDIEVLPASELFQR